MDPLSYIWFWQNDYEIPISKNLGKIQCRWACYNYRTNRENWSKELGEDCNFWKMVDRNIELKALWASSYNTTQFGCKFNIVQMPWTIVSHPSQVVTPNWWKLKCSMKVSINWITNVFARQQVTSLIVMGCMPSDCFSNVKNWDAKKKT
jgi:hypothetical protein